MSSGSSSLRVAVTGGSGSIGHRVIQELVARGHQVVNLDRKQSRDPVKGVRFCYVDLRNRQLVQPILETVDAVCHLGEIPNPGAGPSPDEIFSTNTTIGSCILQTAADLKLRHVVYTSTCQVYGCWGEITVPPVTLPLDESHPVQPQNHYALSKVANEMYAAYVSKQWGLSVSIFRLPVTHEFGERGYYRLEHQTTMYELGTYLHSTDAATAYALAVEKALPGCETYNLVADDAIANEPVAAGLASVYPNGPHLPPDWPATKSPVLSDKAKKKLDWQPKISFLEEFRKKFGREPLKGGVR